MSTYQSENSFKTAQGLETSNAMTLDEMRKEKEGIESVIHRDHPSLSRWVHRWNQSTTDEERRIILAILGDMQVGKSQESGALEKLQIVYGRYRLEPCLAIHMVKQVPHEKDYLKAIERFNANWKNYCQKMAISYKGISCVSISSLSIKDECLKDDKNLKTLKETMKVQFQFQDQSDVIIICQAGPTQMKKLRLLMESVEGVEEYCQHKFILFDESHSTTQWGRGTRTGDDLDKIVSLSNVQLAYCSATPAINLLDEKKPVSLICHIEPKAGYVGPTQLLNSKIDKMNIKKGDDFSKTCPSFEQFLQQVLSQQAVKEAKEYNLSRDTPQFTICQLSPWTRHHRELEALTHAIAPDQINTIVFDSEEKITVRTTSKVQQYINETWGGLVKVNRNTTLGIVTDKVKIDERGVIKFQGNAQKMPAISNVLQIFANIPASVVERIMLHSGDCISESVVCASDDFTISCDMLALNRGEKVPVDRLLQYLRCCHYKLSMIDGQLVPDRRTSTLCCDEELYRDLIKGYLYEKKKVQRLIDDQEKAFIHRKQEVGSYKRIEGYTVNKTRIPKRQLCNKDDVAEVIEKGADSLSVVDGFETGIQMMTEIAKIKRRRQGEYNGVVNETIPEPKEDDEEKDEDYVPTEGTKLEILKKKIIVYVKEKGNNYRSAAEWHEITELCGYKNKTALHYTMMTYLVKQKFLERDNNLLRLKIK